MFGFELGSEMRGPASVKLDEEIMRERFSGNSSARRFQETRHFLECLDAVEMMQDAGNTNNVKGIIGKCRRFRVHDIKLRLICETSFFGFFACLRDADVRNVDANDVGAERGKKKRKAARAVKWQGRCGGASKRGRLAADDAALGGLLL